MTDESVKRILKAPVILLRPSSEEERGRFHNKKGWYYTFGLKSGQSFVAHFSRGQNSILTFRPLNNLVPELTQFKWEQRPACGCLPPYSVFCQTTRNFKCEYHEMLVKAHQVREQLLKNECIKQEFQQALSNGHRQLGRLMVPVQQRINRLNNIQNLMNERRQNG